MTGQNIADAVRAEVIEPNPAFFTDVNLLSLINRAQKTYVRRVRPLKNIYTFNIVAGQATYAVPSDFIGSEKLFANFPNTGIDSWIPLSPTGIEKMSQESPNFLSTDSSARGNPRKYFLEQNTLHVFPIPQTNQTGGFVMFYECTPPVLTALSQTLALDDTLQDGIEAYVLWKMWKQDREPEEAADQYTRFLREIGEGMKWKKKRILDGKWKMDIESFSPFGYSGGSKAFGTGFNPLNL